MLLHTKLNMCVQGKAKGHHYQSEAKPSSIRHFNKQKIILICVSKCNGCLMSFNAQQLQIKTRTATTCVISSGHWLSDDWLYNVEWT